MPFDTRVFKEMLDGKPLDALGGTEQWMFNQLHGVEDVRVGPDGQVWATAQGELFRFEKGTQRFEKFLSRSFFKEKGVVATQFFKTKPQGDSLLWIYGNKAGLYRFHLKTGRLDDFSKGPSYILWTSRCRF